jgi:hypothetical protein
VEKTGKREGKMAWLNNGSFAREAEGVTQDRKESSTEHLIPSPCLFTVISPTFSLFFSWQYWDLNSAPPSC